MRGRGPHVADPDPSFGALQDPGSPGRPGPYRGHAQRAQPVARLEGGPSGPGGRRNRRDEIDAVPDRIGEAGPVRDEEIGEEAADPTCEAPTGLVDRGLLVPHQHCVKGPRHRAQMCRHDRRQWHAEPKGHGPAGEAEGEAPGGRTAADHAGGDPGRPGGPGRPV